VEQLGPELGVTRFMALLAVYAVLLQRYAGQDDIVIGAPRAIPRGMNAILPIEVNGQVPASATRLMFCANWTSIERLLPLLLGRCESPDDSAAEGLVALLDQQEWLVWASGKGHLEVNKRGPSCNSWQRSGSG